MKKTIIFILVALFATGSLYADDISVQQALQIASQFAAKDPTAQSKQRKVAAAMPNPSLAYTVKSDVSDKDNVYVINYGNDMGFVVVSGETGTDAILGYCDHGAFDYKNCPPQMKEVLGRILNSRQREGLLRVGQVTSAMSSLSHYLLLSGINGRLITIFALQIAPRDVYLLLSLRL